MLANKNASKIHFWNKARLIPSPFLVTNSRFLVLVKTFRNDHVAACGIALRAATEKKEKGGYVTVPWLSKMTQCSSTGDWIKL